MLNKQQFMRFVSLYQDRYGQWTMTEPTIQFWFDKLKQRDPNQFKHAYEKLIAAQDKHFGLRLMIETIENMFPPEDAVLKREREWRGNPIYTENKPKQMELNRFLRGLISEMKEAKRKKKKVDFNWIEELAQQFIEIFEPVPAMHIVNTIYGEGWRNEEVFKFCKAVERNLKGRK